MSSTAWGSPLVKGGLAHNPAAFSIFTPRLAYLLPFRQLRGSTLSPAVQDARVWEVFQGGSHTRTPEGGNQRPAGSNNHTAGFMATSLHCFADVLPLSALRLQGP